MHMTSASNGSAGKSARGFAAMKKQGRSKEVSEIARKGGQNSHRNDQS
jgi:hypothetical protein